MKPIILDNSKENAEKAVKALIKQGVPSHKKGVGCKYFLEGSRCIVGHMMSEAEAVNLEKLIEKQGFAIASIAVLIEEGSVELAFPKGLSKWDLATMQNIHDHRPPSEWEENFKVVLKFS